LYRNNYLNAVSALSATEVWAVGEYIPTCCTTRTLIYHLTDPCATPSPTPTRTPLTPLPTFTGAPPTATATHSRTATPTATPTLCAGGHYQISQATGMIVPGTSDIGNHCDDCATAITLPFAYRLY